MAQGERYLREWALQVADFEGVVKLFYVICNAGIVCDKPRKSIGHGESLRGLPIIFIEIKDIDVDRVEDISSGDRQEGLARLWACFESIFAVVLWFVVGDTFDDDLDEFQGYDFQ